MATHSGLTSTAGEDYTHCLMGSGDSGDREYHLSPLSPAESLESLPPTTPPDEYRYRNHGVFGGIPTTISGRLLEYPSPPATTSNPKHSVPLPLTKNTTTMTSNVNMNPYDFPYDPIRHDFVPGSLYIGGLLDSPRSVIQHSTYYTPNTLSLSQQPSLNPHRLLEGSTGTESAPRPIHALSTMLDYEPLSPFLELKPSATSNQLPPLEEGGLTDEDLAALLSPLSPEWESHALDVLPPSSPEVEITRLSRSPDPSPPPSLPPLTPPRSSSSRPTLPLLSIPNPSFSFPSSGSLRSYAPSPESSPLWVADELEANGSSGSETGEAGDAYVVSPPSSGPPDTPSPGVSPSINLPGGHEDGFSDHDAWGKGKSVMNGNVSPISNILDSDEIFEYPSSPPSLSLLSPSLPIPSLPPIPSIPLTNHLPWHEEKLEKELLRSPSVKLRESVDLPDVGFGGAMQRSDADVYPWPMRDDADLDFEGLRQFDDLAVAEPSTATLINQADSFLLQDPGYRRRWLDVGVDSSELSTIHPETLRRLPPQEVEEMKRIAGLQARARECERFAKDLEARVVEAAPRSNEGKGKGPEKKEGVGRKESEGEALEGQDLVVLQTAAVEARSLAKRELEKAREAGALVRLKLQELADEREYRAISPIGPWGQSITLPEHWEPQPLLDAFSSPSPSPSTSSPATPTPTPAPRKHPRLAGIAQLVAKMFLNRHESSSSRPPILSPSSSPGSDPSSIPEPASDRDDVSRSSSTSSDPTPSTSDPSPSRPSPYKYKHLWVKGVTAATLHRNHPFTGSSSQGHGLAITDKLGPGATRQQPFAQYQQRYKFLRSSPLARYSVVASDLDAEEVDAEGEGLDDPNTPAGGHKLENDDPGNDPGVGGLWDDEEDTEGGFEALRNPIMWDAI